MSTLNQFFIECLDLKYSSNSQDNSHHEEAVESLLIKHNLTYEYQPNGTHQSPDFRVHHNGKTYDIECKSSKEAYPTYNGGLPKEGVIYVFSSKKYNETTVFFAEDVVSEKKRELYKKLIADLRITLKEYQTMPEWQDPERGFDFYIRNMFTQSGGKDKTNYFTHAKRGYCEDRVVNYTF